MEAEAFICWFVLQVAATARKLILASVWVARTGTLGASPVTFSSALAGSWAEAELLAL